MTEAKTKRRKTDYSGAAYKEWLRIQAIEDLEARELALETLPKRIYYPAKFGFDDVVMYRNGDFYLTYWSPKLERNLESPLGTNVIAKIAKLRKRYLESLGEQKSKEALSFKTWRDVAEGFKEEAVWKSENTKRTALNQIDKHLIPYFGGYDPEEINDNKWQKYGQGRREKAPKCSLLNAMKYFWAIQNWAHEKGIVKTKFTPFDFDANRKSPGVLVSREQLNSIQAHLAADVVWGSLWIDLSEMAWEMAFRRGELSKLEWDRVNLETGEITLELEHTKTRRGRKPVMTRKARSIMERRFEARQGPYVFPMATNPKRPLHDKDKPWQDAKRKAGVKCRFHDLRHTWLTNAFKASNKYAEICEYAGLTLDEALKTYVKFGISEMQSVASIFDNELGKTREGQRNEQQ
jgi:integrase